MLGKVIAFMAAAFLLLVGGCTFQGIVWHINVDGHLKRAADANTVSLAMQELETALAYVKEKGLEKGNTSIWWEVPENDIEFWISNLTQSLEELKRLPEDSSTLEKSNTLLKLRETILDDGSRGQHVTQPNWIYVFPLQRLVVFGCFLLICVSILVIAAWPLSTEVTSS